jgi:pyruvate dehydrogenase (quinone)
VPPTLEQILEYDGPALIEIPVSRQELSMSPTINDQEAKGFGLFMLRVVLNGRADELIDLARVNLLR